ncbi:MAG: hypothetical protein IOC63_08130 [Methylobacterium sp.]|nr:hypothetical protein [Methylobacterium sp.]
MPVRAKKIRPDKQTEKASSFDQIGENARGRAASREIEDDGRCNPIRRQCLDQEGWRGRQGFAFGRLHAI